MTLQWDRSYGPISRPALPPARPTADIYETAGGDAFVLEIPVPGLKAHEISIEVDVNTLTVSTRPEAGEPESRRYVQREQAVRPMSRLFEFPTEIDLDNVRATLEHGILKIRVPRAASSRRKTIKVA